jgi:2-hydroxychromene-2-carboxylate isomerase
VSKFITYYYSHASPWSYLGHQRLADIAARQGATVDYVPITLSGIFPRTGGVPLPKRAPERQAYRLVELERWPRLLGIPLNPQPRFFPVDDRPSARLALAAKARGDDIAELSLGLMRACWVEERDLTDPATLQAIADTAGLDGRQLLDEAETEHAQVQLEEACDQAVADGCFGVPWYVVDGEPFWGQDHLDMVGKALAGELQYEVP